MLAQLRVRSFAIIDELSLDFEMGLNILSGETGAGKSVILKSLSLLMGEKAATDTIRSGSKQAVVEGLFEIGDRPDTIQLLEKMGIEITEGELIVRRVLAGQGKSRVYLNGVLSPLSTLKEIVSPLLTVTGLSQPLIEMTGQHENRDLQNRTYHLDLLDRYCGSWVKRSEFETQFDQRQAKVKELNELKNLGPERIQRIDFLKFQAKEIDRLNLKPGEEAELEEAYSGSKSFRKILDYSQKTESLLASEPGGALTQIQELLSLSLTLPDLAPTLVPHIGGLESAKASLEDFLFEVQKHIESIDLSPEKIEEIEVRLSALRKLQKKFGQSSEEILEWRSNMEEELSRLEESDFRIEELETQIQKLSSDLQTLGEELHVVRENGAKLLEKSVSHQLLDLNMKGLEFVVDCKKAGDFLRTGLSLVEFLVRPEKKASAKPLAKTASGGELSRILLALKTCAGQSEQPRTLLFDEVDAGVSGETAQKVGSKLKDIADGQQVICVTHLPQVAAYADHHFHISKQENKGRQEMSVLLLKSKDRVKEIARLVSGEKISNSSMKYAKQLLEESAKI